MESSGVPGSIQISPTTHMLIADEFVCEARGMTSIKGKEPMETFLLVSRRSSVPASVG
jgi:adenylate cyclase